MPKLLPILALVFSLPAQTLVADGARPSSGAVPEPVERAEGQGFPGDQAGDAKSCPRLPGGRVEKVVLWGALDNPPVAGQPACACHALVQIASAALEPAASAPPNASLKLAAEGAPWRPDFENLPWSLPGGMDVLFAARDTGLSEAAACAAENWALIASPAAGEWRFSANHPARGLNVQARAPRVQREK